MGHRRVCMCACVCARECSFLLKTLQHSSVGYDNRPTHASQFTRESGQYRWKCDRLYHTSLIT